MTPKTKQEALRLIEELKAKIGELPDEARPVTEGWDLCTPGAWCRVGSDGLRYTVAVVRRDGLHIRTGAEPALDGIAHDEKGRIKVVGYVNAEELKERVNRFGLHAKEAVCLIIDKLAG